ncbi:hypothetical protein [Xenorhabdus koppenhoeferi]|uniref:Uncharacterized protein n=1 Tax=Xenorhabdus koppenhoeferi TaxID=351659 RepID=A0A1I7J0T1_9GAMM|nr:hypothetical protein [Xenorhabdus koppenhoeferi]SFU78809.1 hypothetical protein SAMN05421784_1266 [Xenorhabdus koppenhoeferi]
MYGTYKTEGTLTVCKSSTLTEAFNKLKVIYREDNWSFRDEDADYYDSDLGHDVGPLDFFPRTVMVYDRYNKKVLGGELHGDLITWARSITQEAELISLKEKYKCL